MTTTTPTAPIPCRVCPELVHPGQRALVLTAEVAYHAGCLLGLCEAEVIGGTLTERLERAMRERMGA